MDGRGRVGMVPFSVSLILILLKKYETYVHPLSWENRGPVLGEQGTIFN